jgi:hypothetical protein
MLVSPSRTRPCRTHDRGGRVTVDAVGFANLDVDEAGDAAGPGRHVSSGAPTMSGAATTPEIAKRPPGRGARAASRSTRGLSPEKVDDAVGDHDVAARVGERQFFEVALD